jgi:hypothetical protein
MGLNFTTSFALAGLAAPSGILGTDAVQAETERKLSLSGTALATKEGQAPRLPLPFFIPVTKTQSGPVAPRRNKHALACALSFLVLDIRKPKRGVLVTPPSSMTWRNKE